MFISPVPSTGNPLDLIEQLAVSFPVIALTLVAIALFVSGIKRLVLKPKNPLRRRRFHLSAANAALGLSFPSIRRNLSPSHD
jgi:amino acid transporter